MYCEFSLYCLRVESYELYLVLYGVEGEDNIMARIISYCGLISHTSLKIWTVSEDHGRESGGQAYIIFHGVVVILVVSHCKTKERETMKA